MKFLFILFTLSIEINSQKFTLSLQEIDNQKNTSTNSNFTINDLENYDGKLDVNDLIDKINNSTSEKMVINFTNEQNQFSSYLTKNKEEKLKTIQIEVNLSQDKQIMSIFVKKNYSGNNLLNQVKFIRSEQNVKSNDIPNFKMPQPNTKVPPNMNNMNQESINGQNNTQQQQPEEEKTFFQKYFWYIMIGGFLIMQVMNVDKQKLNEAYEQAQQQAQQRGGQGQNVQRRR